MASAATVLGVDVGGSHKGFHVIALRDGRYHSKFHSIVTTEVAEWCRTLEASVIAIDAPCQWSSNGRARAAERGLMAEGIWCFSTPRVETAHEHPKDHFRWMLNGAELYKSLRSTHELFLGVAENSSKPIVFETFPHAITWALAGRRVWAKYQRSDRLGLLALAGIDAGELTNIDWIDAALCALAGYYFSLGNFKTYGDQKSGLIVVPARPPEG